MSLLLSDPRPDNHGPLCTRAITGSERPAHQSIFVCYTCQSLEGRGRDDDGGEERLPACVCQSCAYDCHADHKIFYVGVGPCTCDCTSMAHKQSGGDFLVHECRLAARSAVVAERLGFADLRPLNYPILLKAPRTLSGGNDGNVNESKREEEKDGNENETKGDEIGCHSSIDGYIYASFTLPALVNNGGQLCRNLIRQAKVLADCSRDTFWLPDDDDGSDASDCNEWCDLEILARKIYRQHIHSYSLQTPASETGGRANEGDDAKPMSGGAEWWVQVKPAGMSRAPVDLHYDKDEVLAETFCLGSFPTLSTVTYLTGEGDNSPTVVFPHTYHDEEGQPIATMLLSHAARAKHLVFDGRLLHGAPAHPSLRRCSNSNGENGGSNGAIGDAEGGSSLRVTFLVNIWKSGRPAGVNILSQSFRDRIRSAASESTSLHGTIPLEFQPRHTSKLSIPPKPSSDNCDDGKKKALEQVKIILPFICQGATWIGGDRAEMDVEENGGESKDDGKTNAQSEDDADEGDKDDGSENSSSEEEENDDEEDEELFLVLPPFTTIEYVNDKADSIVLSFEDGNGARLMRKRALDETVKLSAERISEQKYEEEHEKTYAGKFLLHLTEHVPSFVSSIIAELKSQCDIDVSRLQADHVCYRTDSLKQYTSLVESLQSTDVKDFTLLVESKIGGRPISTFKLAAPIEIKSADSDHSIDVIEIPSPKEGSPYKAGLEHVEFVIGGSTHQSPSNDKTHREVLTSWMERHPSVHWNLKALHKQCNPDVSTKLDLGAFGVVSIKFHLIPLEKVIEFEVGGL